MDVVFRDRGHRNNDHLQHRDPKCGSTLPSVKVGQTQFVSWQDWGGFLNSSNSIYKTRETCSDA